LNSRKDVIILQQYSSQWGIGANGGRRLAGTNQLNDQKGIQEEDDSDRIPSVFLLLAHFT
jgi:hypothetical protein